MRGECEVAVTMPGGWKMHTTVQLEKAITTPAMNGLAGMEITNFDVASTSDDAAPTQIATVRVHNPSQISIQPLGTLSTNIVYKGSRSVSSPSPSSTPTTPPTHHPANPPPQYRMDHKHHRNQHVHGSVK